MLLNPDELLLESVQPILKWKSDLVLKEISRSILVNTEVKEKETPAAKIVLKKQKDNIPSAVASTNNTVTTDSDKVVILQSGQTVEVS